MTKKLTFIYKGITMKFKCSECLDTGCLYNSLVNEHQPCTECDRGDWYVHDTMAQEREFSRNKYDYLNKMRIESRETIHNEKLTPKLL